MSQGLVRREGALLSECTRFEIGGPADALVDVYSESDLRDAISDAQSAWTLIGGGSNLVCADEGFRGSVIRYCASNITIDGEMVHVQSGALLQELVDRTIAAGLQGLETMTGIPGWVGGAVYGNAGAYGHSIHERVVSVRYFDTAQRQFGELENRECGFRYRESIFKRNKTWIVTSATFRLERADIEGLRGTADAILKMRNEKYPPTMRCAGSIFKNLIIEELPLEARDKIPMSIVREGKGPSAYVLEQVGAKGMSRGGIRVADYHANLLYNTGGGTAAEVRALITELKERVRRRFGIEIEEEVQFIS